MQGAITYNELGLLLAFLIFLGIGVYAIIALKNLNLILKNANTALESNREEINKIIPDLAEISDDARIVSKQAVKSADEAGRAIQTITNSTADAVVKFSETADRIGEYTVVIEEVVKTVSESFSRSRKC